MLDGNAGAGLAGAWTLSRGSIKSINLQASFALALDSMNILC